MERAHGWQLDRDRLAGLLEQEERRFVDDHPGSQQLFERGEKAMLSGVPCMIPGSHDAGLWLASQPAIASRPGRSGPG